MTKTLADMTAEEREECVGMWASHKRHDGNEDLCENLGIISEVEEGYAWLTYPKEGMEPYVFFFEDVTPRFDLPRACTPDGEPVQMDVEHEVVQEHPRGGMIGTFENPEYTSLVPGTEVKRWVSDWEPVPTPRKINGMVNPHV